MEELQGDTEGEGQMTQVLERPGEGVTEYALPKTARNDEGSYSTGGRRGRRGRRAHNLTDLIPDKGGANALLN